MKEYHVYGAKTNLESKREIENKNIARQVAEEGIVLLKNDNALPYTGKEIALYGPGSRMTVKGGRGSGDVRERHSVTIEEGLKKAGYTFPTTLWMDRFEEKYKKDVEHWRNALEEEIKKYSPIKTMDMFIKIGETPMPYPTCTPVKEDEVSKECDTAIYVLARQAGEGDDRKYEKGDYFMTDIECDSLRMLSSNYKKLILVLNCGSVIDLSILDEIRVDAVIFYAQGGMSGGDALANLILGKATPSAKLTDTWAVRYEDYPSYDTFSHMNGNTLYEEYKEGIYVGYRYFSTFNVKPRFCFGHGLSYTTFQHEVESISVQESFVTMNISVNNSGALYSGKEILQAYIQKPNVSRDHEKLGLVAFGKTKELACMEKQSLKMQFNLTDVADYSEDNEAFILQAGEYGLYVGTSVQEIELAAVLQLSESVTVEQAATVCPKKLAFHDLVSNAVKEEYPENITRYKIDLSNHHLITHTKKRDELFSSKVMKKIEQLSVKEQAMLTTGGGYSIKCLNNVMGAAGRTCTKLVKKGIPNIVMADGPAGLNVIPETVTMKDGTPRFPNGLPDDWNWGWLKKAGVLVKAKPGKGRSAFRYMTAWPSATLQAQTWNTELLETVGRAVGREMLEIGVSIWLAPGMNIHRNPLCGRNFEYYSEDPLLSGKMAAAITRGVQSCGGVGVTVKHFCCNNQEEQRMKVSENVSQRALREIYLRGFRIAVQEGKPWTIMTSYNKVNDVYVCNSYDFCTRVLREEWGFEGLVMSDWNATEQCSYSMAINAGNDMIMPGTKEVTKALMKDYKAGQLKQDALMTSAARVLKLIYASETCKEY